MPDHESNWSEAVDLIGCIHCGNDRNLERRGHEWFCPCCSRQWNALTSHDKLVLRALRIAPQE